MFAELDDYNARIEFEEWLESTIPGMEELARMAGMEMSIRRDSFGDATYVIRENGFDYTTRDRDRAVRFLRGTEKGL